MRPPHDPTDFLHGYRTAAMDASRVIMTLADDLEGRGHEDPRSHAEVLRILGNVIARLAPTLARQTPSGVTH